jgi:phospholipid/cholesterol/gamma-HCH transport system substrate-binding protein
MKGMRTTAAKFAAFALVSALLFVLLFNTMRNSVAGDSHEYSATFSSVSGLRQGDDVRVAGVKVGRVERIVAVGEDPVRAQVTFTLGADQDLRDNSRVVVRYQNLLGQRYLALVAGDGEGRRIEPGGEVPLANTDPGFDLTALLNGFEPLFAVIEPSEVNELAGNLIAVLQGESGTVENLLAQTADVTRFLNDRDEVFTQVLDNLTPVLQNLSARNADIDTTVVELRGLMTGLAEQRRTIGSSLDGISAMVGTTKELLEDTREPFTKDVNRLRRATGVLSEERAKLADAIKVLPIGVEAFARSQSYGAKLNVYVCNLAVEVAGVKAHVGPTGGPYSEVCR